MAEKDDVPVQGDLLKALDDLTELIEEQEQRGRVWSDDDEEDDDDFEAFEFDAEAEAAALLAEVSPAPQEALPSPAEIESIVEQVIGRRMENLRDEIAREIMVELRRRYPAL